MSKTFDLNGKTVVLTGAASGIGAELARQLVALGANLALVDRDADGLATIHDAVSAQCNQVSAHVLDITDAVGIATLPNKVLEHHDQVDVLINNAGATIAGDFLEVDQTDFEWLMDINFYGTVRMTRAFLPMLMARPEANVSCVSSVFGIVAVPGQAAYCASKFAVRGFSNALRYEMERAEGDVKVMTIHPGGIKTNIARNAKPHADMSEEDAARSAKRMERAFITTPEKAAADIIRGITRRHARVVIGPDARNMVWLERLRPVRAWDMIIGGIRKRVKGKKS